MYSYNISKSLGCDEIMKYEFTSKKFENHSVPDDTLKKGKVKLTDLMMRLEREKKKERQSNIALSVATVSSRSSVRCNFKPLKHKLLKKDLIY